MTDYTVTRRTIDKIEEHAAELLSEGEGIGLLEKGVGMHPA